jgi:hypothetical protein
MGSPFSEPVNQLGCVVPDLDQAIQSWVGLGVGPWLTMHHVEVGGYRYEGRTSKPRSTLPLPMRFWAPQKSSSQYALEQARRRTRPSVQGCPAPQLR